MMSICCVCSASPATPCSGCTSVSYCGKECQKKDWKLHKAKCKTYKVVHCPEEHGRSIVAARDVKPGEVIIKTLPMVVGPRMYRPSLCCVGCHKVRTDLLKCPQCSLPVCNQKCANGKTHQAECTLISHSLQQGNQVDVNVHAVTVLRILALKLTKPNQFSNCLSLEPNLETLRERELWGYLQKHVIQPVLTLKMEGVTEDIVERAAGILLTNSFEVMAMGSLLYGVFFEPSLMNHDCVGNVRIMLDSNHQMTVMASLPIKKNSQIKFNYGRALDPTLTRQSMLLENKYFSCRCPRCVDPTELGSHTSSLKCRVNKCTGAVVAEAPCSDCDWVCTQCEDRQEAQTVSNLLSCLEKDLEGLDRNSIKDVKQMMSKYSNKLHKNHGVLVELKQIVVSGLGRLPGYTMEDMTESDHKQKILLCQDVLSVLQVVEPGLSLGRGLMLFELHSSLVVVSNLEFDRKGNSSQLLTRLLEASKFLREAGQILRYEPVNSPYGHLASTVESNLEELRQYCDTVKNM